MAILSWRSRNRTTKSSEVEVGLAGEMAFRMALLGPQHTVHRPQNKVRFLDPKNPTFEVEQKSTVEVVPQKIVLPQGGAGSADQVRH